MHVGNERDHPTGDVLADASQLVCFVDGSRAVVFDVHTGQPAANLPSDAKSPHAELASAIAFSSDGRLLALPHEQLRDGVILWQPQTDVVTKLRSGVSRSLLVMLFTAAFIAWAVAWGWMHRRQAQRQATQESARSIQAQPFGRPRVGGLAIVMSLLVLFLMSWDRDNGLNWGNLSIIFGGLLAWTLSSFSSFSLRALVFPAHWQTVLWPSQTCRAIGRKTDVAWPARAGLRRLLWTNDPVGPH